jgi:RecJ-like exonuclease
MLYQSKKQTCPLCKGKKTVATRKTVLILDHANQLSQEAEDLAIAMVNNTCPHCNGAGEVSVPPYNTGENTKMGMEKVRELAEAGTLIRCIGDAVFVQAVANEAARIALPKDIVMTYVAYWSDPSRDVTLGGYIRQIAQSAEELALRIYGDLGNPIYAAPRHCGEIK